VAFSGDLTVISSVDDYANEVHQIKRKREVVKRKQGEDNLYTLQQEDVESVRKLDGGARPQKTAGGKRKFGSTVPL
jgi:hypothetical protein